MSITSLGVWFSHSTWQHRCHRSNGDGGDKASTVNKLATELDGDQHGMSEQSLTSRLARLTMPIIVWCSENVCTTFCLPIGQLSKVSHIELVGFLSYECHQ